MTRGWSRRRVLAGLGTGIAVAGCLDGTGDDDGPDDGGDGGDDGADGDSGEDPDDGQTDGTAPDDGDPGGEPGPELPGTIRREPLAEGLEAPVAAVAAPGSDRLYVCEQPGRIRLLEAGSLRPEPVLDLTDAVTTGREQGLLGLALHPAFAETRRAFVRYSAPSRPGTPEAYSHTFVLAEFSVAEDGRRFDADSERTLLEIPEPQGNHNAGDLAFGPDGFLYVPVGDGGAANDQGPGHVADWYDAVDGGNGQDVTDNLLGGILRLDVEGDPYAIPEDNPLRGRRGRDEYYAWGLRNPWRISFDGEDCLVADVGQSGYEEVNRVVAGGNYGWNVREGTHCFQADTCPDATPPDVRGGEPLRDPVVEYPRGGAEVSGISVIGGYVYRGERIDGLDGQYVFGDLVPEGKLFVATPEDGEGTWPTAAVDVAGASPEALYSFGRDRDGELYALGIGENGGTVWTLHAA